MDAAQLEARLLEAPEDEDTWSVYADLLLSRGDVRGELIVLERRAEASPQDKHLREQLDRALYKNEQALLGPLARSRKHRFTFWRGFVISASLGSSPDMALLQLGQRPAGRLLRALELKSFRGASELRDTFERLSSFELHALTIQRGYVAVQGAQLIAGCPALGALRRLNLADNRLDDDSIPLLAQAELPQLQELNLGQNGLGPRAARALAKAPWRALRSLHLSSCPIGDEGLEALAEGRFALEALSLPNANLSEASARAMANSEKLTGLRRLSLSNNALGLPGVQSLVGARFAPALESLELRSCEIDNEGARALASAPFLRLARLDLRNNPIADAGKQALLTSTTLPPSARLSLGRAPFA